MLEAKKRKAPPLLEAFKKRKIANSSGSQANKYSIKPRKPKAADRGTIPIPMLSDASDAELSDQDFQFLETYGNSATFLGNLDQKDISRSKKEIERLRQVNKPVRQLSRDDGLPPIDSDADSESWDSDIDYLVSEVSDGCDEYFGFPEEEEEEEGEEEKEMPYEKTPREAHSIYEQKAKTIISRLPIKLPDGRVQQIGTRATALAHGIDKSEESGSESLENEAAPQEVEDVSTGARFGRPAVADVVGNKSRAARIHDAKEEIASICQDILTDPENSLGLLRRLHTFSLVEIASSNRLDLVSNDPIIRKLAMLSQLAVFKDIIPGYRIRPLTDKEKAEKVGQIVAHTRDWEQGLVAVYQSYLQSLEAEIKAHSNLSEVALNCICTLLAEATHFNFRVNLMTCVVAKLSRKRWDKSSDLCASTLVRVFRGDLDGTASLEIVRLMNRMIKERRYNVHPEVLSCLLHLRLKHELNVRTSVTLADEVKLHSRSKAASRRAKGKHTAKPHLSKKARKHMKEMEEIGKELREAEAEVDKEERALTQTETLKLLFVLYFSILKNLCFTPLLPAALRGISKFAHLINVDFFRDLMKVLKELMTRGLDTREDGTSCIDELSDVRLNLLCIITAFELLTGQGDALNLDLSSFVSSLYATILSLNIDAPPVTSCSSQREKTQPIPDLLFQALNHIFSSRAAAPPMRSAAFAKRLLIACLHWSPDIVLRTLDFVAGLIAKSHKLETLLSTDDRAHDAVYRPDLDEPELSHPFGTSFWELHLLRNAHYDTRVRQQAEKLLNTAPTQ